MFLMANPHYAPVALWCCVEQAGTPIPKSQLQEATVFGTADKESMGWMGRITIPRGRGGRGRGRGRGGRYREEGGGEGLVG
jgi:hypothetical protein